MYCKLLLLGTGAETDPYRVDFPSYNMVSEDLTEMTAIVVIADRYGPPQHDAKGSPSYPIIGEQYVLIALSPDQLSAWWALLDRYYPNRPQPYRPAFNI